MDPYEALANAVIEQAAKDYRDACFLLKWKRCNRTAEDMKCDCESFFTSEWCKVLTNLDGAKILGQLRKEVAV